MPAAEPPQGCGRSEGAAVTTLPCPTTKHGGIGLGPEAGLAVMMVNFSEFQSFPVHARARARLENPQTALPPCPLALGSVAPPMSVIPHCPGLH